MRNNKLRFGGLIIAGVIVIAGFIYALNVQPVVMGDPQDSYYFGDSQLKRFNSYRELTEYLTNENINPKLKLSDNQIQLWGSAPPRSVTFAEELEVSYNSAVIGMTKSTSHDELVDYSNTNIQDVGVDEPDIVKTDGEYIYIVDNNKIIIVLATPAEDAEIISEIEIKDSLKIVNLFLSNERLVIFANSAQPILYETDNGDKGILPNILGLIEPDVEPPIWYTSPETHIQVFDISNLEDPEQVKEIVVHGRYTTARLIGDYVYVITNQYSYDIRPMQGDKLIFPIIRVDGKEKKIDLQDISYVNTPADKSITNIFSFNVQDKDSELKAKMFLMGNSNIIYVSKQNIYLTMVERNYNYETIKQITNEILYDYLPNLFVKEIESVNELSLEDYQKKSVSEWIIQNYIKDFSDEEKNEISREINKRIEKTTIYRVKIKDGEIEYKAKGEIPGTVNNQFSLSEFEGFLRVSSTNEGRTISGFSWLDRQNNVYVLNLDMDIVGSIEGLAPGERIYATRFLGDKCYLVTFRQIDPFFVIDLEDPYNPELLGELKIPGYSTYLHPYDESHVIGIGEENRKVKLSLFDVTDLTNPEEISKYIIEFDENSWRSNSEALYEHKAFLFDKEKELLVIPAGTYSKQSAHVFNISLEDGIKLKGVIEHGDPVNPDEYWRYDYDDSITRTLYIGDVLYTLSNNMLKMNDLSDLSEINSVLLN
jgi:uncharacterized secreted protein with C-terminal beta-propeller domain